MGRTGERAELQRLKFTAILTDVPFVIDAQTVTPEGESPYVVEEMIPRLAQRSERMRAAANAQGRTDFEGVHRAAALGDNAFANNPVYEALYAHGMYGAFEPPGFPSRFVEGRRRVSYKVDDAHGKRVERYADLFACNDGVHFCECEAGKPAAERTPMAQYAGRFGSGHVYVKCWELICPRRGQPLYVPFRKPDRVLAGGRREAGDINYTRVTPLWRGDKVAAVANWQGRQTIEHYHQQRFELFGLGSKDRRSMRRFTGDAAVGFWHLLGDLLWNLTVLENLDSGAFVPELIDIDIAYQKLLANGHSVARRRALARAGRAERAEQERTKRGKHGQFKSGAPPD